MYYGYTRFGNDTSTLAGEDAYRVGKTSLERRFVSGNKHFSGPMYSLKIILLVENNPFFPSIAKALRDGGGGAKVNFGYFGYVQEY